MSLKIGFAILSHNEPEQLLRLAKTLNAVFGEPPIACHHNFSQCSFDEALFPANVRFVHPHIETRWGHITCALAALRAFSLLRKYDQPDWVFLLSGSDYPVRKAEEIIADLCNSRYDAYVDTREISLLRICQALLSHGALPPGQTAGDSGFGRPSWIRLAYRRYCTFYPCDWVDRNLIRRFISESPIKKLLLNGTFLLRREKFVPIRNHKIDLMTRRFQFNRPARIYGGDFWFHGNQKAIGRLLDDPSMPKLLRYYRSRPIPEESIFQTALCNQVGLRICNNHKRYEDWTNGGLHPKWLDVSDMPRIAASDAYFARKFHAAQSLEFVDAAIF